MEFPLAEKFTDEKKNRNALAHKGFGNFIHRLSQQLGISGNKGFRRWRGDFSDWNVSKSITDNDSPYFYLNSEN